MYDKIHYKLKKKSKKKKKKEIAEVETLIQFPGHLSGSASQGEE